MQEKNIRINEIYVQMQPGKELLHLLPLKRTIFYGSNLPTYESEAGSSAFDSCEVTCIEKIAIVILVFTLIDLLGQAFWWFQHPYDPDLRN